MNEDPHMMEFEAKWILNNTIVQFIDQILTRKVQAVSNKIQENIPIIKRMQDNVDKEVL
jgi:aspartyl/asparaginyl-tRNA synthetase